MSKQKKKDQPSKAPQVAAPESQFDRWVKYGSNVFLSIILVIVLAIGLIWFTQTWLAQRANARLDLTAGGSLSLKPQTINVLNDLKEKITLVSLYARPDNQPEQDAMAGRVSDLLDEYKGKSSRIEVKVIDPLKQKEMLEDLHQDFISRYGSEIKVYKDYLEEWKKQFDQIKKLVDAERNAIAPFSPSDEPGVGGQSAISPFVRTITDELPEQLNNARTAVDHELKKRHPDYKAAAATAKEQMQNVSQLGGAVIEQAPAIAQAPDKEVPPAFKKYLAESLPHYQELKKIADDTIAKGNNLGELKVDQLEQALNVENPILVLGEKDWRILPQAHVFQDDTDVKALNAGGKVTPRFAGEQQVTTAIYGLENPKKQKICFVRAGGQPFTQPGFPPFVPGGPLSTFGERLRDYNFDVTEKDLTGQWAIQAQSQRMPSAPEPSDDEIRDAIWVVLDFPQQQNEGMPNPPSPLAGRLKEHLAHGGSAMVLAELNGDNLLDALKDWGVQLHADAIAVHETVKLTESTDSDPIEQAKARPYIWDCRDYGTHPLAAPIKNLDSVFVAPIVVRTVDASGCTITPLLPYSDNMPGLKTWGDVNVQELEKGDPQYHADKDLAPPIFGGAIVEKKGAGRLVVIGSVRSFTNGFLRILDPRLARRDPPLRVNRFPGNAELVTNSVFWLAHLEPMIAISPAAMDVSRISDMSKGVLNFWRVGVLLILLPGAVLAAGAFVYAARRD